jgi:hypothetical protein
MWQQNISQAIKKIGIHQTYTILGSKGDAIINNTDKINAQQALINLALVI